MIKAARTTPIIGHTGLDFDDPLQFISCFWPHIKTYEEQAEIPYSVRDNHATIVPAGNMLGKDFISGLIVLWFFCTRTPCRVVTTSVDYPQLESVLWGEIRRFVNDAVHPLPIEMQHMHIHQIVDGQREPRSEVTARVAKKGEGMLGRHLETTDGRPNSLCVFDEASGIDDETWNAVDTWCKRKLAIGNPYPCENFFINGVQEGNQYSRDKKTCYRNIIRIRATDSPNVKLALREIAEGLEPSNRVLIPGVLTWEEYVKRCDTWDEIRQTIGLRAEFYLGSEILLFPPERLDAAERLALGLQGTRKAEAMGLDPGEGGDSTVWTVIDKHGIIEQISMKTPDTTEITSRTLALIKKYNLNPRRVAIDRGGGGKQIADQIRKQGYKVKTVAFGESASDPDRFKRMRTSVQKSGDAERRTMYKNRRAEMYGMAADLLDKGLTPDGFGIPGELKDLRHQLSKMPRMYDEEGKLMMPPKRHKAGVKEPSVKSLVQILGRSPDEADSFVLAVFALFDRSGKFVAGSY